MRSTPSFLVPGACAILCVAILLVYPRATDTLRRRRGCRLRLRYGDFEQIPATLVETGVFIESFWQVAPWLHCWATLPLLQ